MPEKPETPHTSADAAIEHMEEEIEALEKVSTKSLVMRWAVGIVCVGAIIAAYLIWTPGKKTSAPAGVFSSATAILLEEPRAGKLPVAPSHFAWESISGRHHYLFQLKGEGALAPMVERQVKTSSIDLTGDETSRMFKGGSYVWSVAARDKNGTVLAAGTSRFQL